MPRVSPNRLPARRPPRNDWAVRFPTPLLAALLFIGLCVTGASMARADSPAALREKYASMTGRLEQSPFQRPLVVDSTEAPDRVQAYDRMLDQIWPWLDRMAAKLAARGVHEVQLLGTSGTITTLASVQLGLPGYDRRRVDGCAVDTASLAALCRSIGVASVQERSRIACVGPDRAELIVAGCAILEAILTRWPGGQVRVADRGIREGILRTLMTRDGVWAAGK